MSGVCVVLKGNAFITAVLTPLEALMVSAALEVGKKCSIASTLDSFLGEDFKEALETAFKAVLDAASTLYKSIQSVISTYNALLEDGLNILKSSLDAAYALINNTLLNLDFLVGEIAKFIANAVNAVLSAGCNTLNSAVSGLPSAVTLTQPGIAVATGLLQTGNIQKFVANMLEKQGVKNIKNSIINSRNSLNNIVPIPNLKPYICTPI